MSAPGNGIDFWEHMGNFARLWDWFQLHHMIVKTPSHGKIYIPGAEYINIR